MQKKVTEPYLVDALSFTEAEARIIEGDDSIYNGRDLQYRTLNYVPSYGELFPATRNYDRWFKCKLIFITLDEKSGAEKRLHSKCWFRAVSRLAVDAVKKLDEGMKANDGRLP